ncbi:MAG: hypothetical protein LZF86_190391 [Nitrospira sp.]|nr:MAG: hypothetical protein LZF86_190391 [Nitrospira sp.]
MNNVTDAIRSAAPQVIKKPLREVLATCRKVPGMLRWLDQGCIRPAMSVGSWKVRFYTRYFENGCKAKTILTLPHKPEPSSVLYKICHELGLQITDRVGTPANLVVNWEDCTIRRRLDVLEELSVRQPVLNLRCVDISKRTVEAVHQAVFGYGLAVNPLEFVGQCVKKSNTNAMHDGRIIQCPVTQIDEQAVYQRVVNNSRDGRFIEDIRVPVCGDVIPFCYRKIRSIERRFGLGADNISAQVCDVSDLLSASEVGLLLRLCKEIGLDYGELDVLRNVDDGKVYVVDVNTTPDGPTKCMDRRSAALAIERLSEAFAASFRLNS